MTTIVAVHDNTFTFDNGNLTIKSSPIDILGRFLYIVTVYSGSFGCTVQNSSLHLVSLINDSQWIKEKRDFPNYSQYKYDDLKLTFSHAKKFWNSLKKSLRKIIISELNDDMYIEDGMKVFEYGSIITGSLSTVSSIEEIFERCKELITNSKITDDGFVNSFAALDSKSVEDNDIDGFVNSTTNENQFMLFLMNIIRDKSYKPYDQGDFNNIWNILSDTQKYVIIDRLNAPNYSGIYDEYSHRFW